LVANTQISSLPSSLANSLHLYAHGHSKVALRYSPAKSYAVPDAPLGADDLTMAIWWPTNSSTSDSHCGASAHSCSYTFAAPSPLLATNLWPDTNLDPQLVEIPTVRSCGEIGSLRGGITPSLPAYVSQLPASPRVIEFKSAQN
jgi:hypothetical protein